MNPIAKSSTPGDNTISVLRTPCEQTRAALQETTPSASCVRPENRQEQHSRRQHHQRLAYSLRTDKSSTPGDTISVLRTPCEQTRTALQETTPSASCVLPENRQEQHSRKQHHQRLAYSLRTDKSSTPGDTTISVLRTPCEQTRAALQETTPSASCVLPENRQEQHSRKQHHQRLAYSLRTDKSSTPGDTTISVLRTPCEQTRAVLQKTTPSASCVLPENRQEQHSRRQHHQRLAYALRTDKISTLGDTISVLRTP